MASATASTELATHRAHLTELERRGIAHPESFTQFVARHNPSLLDFEHVPRMVDCADRVASGEISRLLVILAPRYFKSEVFSRLLPGYFLRQNPHRLVGLASYGADLAWSLSEEARNYFEIDHGRLAQSTAGKKRWKTNRTGEMWAAGVGGPLLGFGYHLGIVDDPTDPEKAHSPTYQRRFRDWWPSKFLSRQEPGARIVFVMQRLGLDDPVDLLFRREVGDDTDEAPENWHVVLCDEIRSNEPLGRWDGPMGLPPTCTLEPDHRALGEVLAPSRFSPERVKLLQRAAGPLVASAQRQGRPMAASGDFWRKDWFRVYDQLPGHAYNGGRDWDTAYTKREGNSASACVLSYRGPGKDGEFPIYIDDVDWDWREFPELVDWMRTTSGPHFVEQKASGKSVVQALMAEQIAATEVTVLGDKFARAAAIQPVASNRRVWVRKEVLHSLLYGERQGLLRVTAENLQAEGEDLDVNDAFVQALTRHIGLHGKRFAFQAGSA
jgi:phage terminase large subunit-like protein